MLPRDPVNSSFNASTSWFQVQRKSTLPVAVAHRGRRRQPRLAAPARAARTLVTGVFSLTDKKRAISTSVCMRAHGNVGKGDDYALPSSVDRRDCPLPDAAHVKIFSASRKTLKEKEEAPGSILSVDENVELCRGKFSESFADTNRSTHKCKTVVGAAMFSWGVPLLF